MQINLNIPKVDGYGNETPTDTVVDYSFEEGEVVIDTVTVDGKDVTGETDDYLLELIAGKVKEKLC